MTDNMKNEQQDKEPERICDNCSNGHPAEPTETEFAICLLDPDFEPYLDDILDRQDFSRCAELVARKRFLFEREACDRFEPSERVELDISPEAEERIKELAKCGSISAARLKQSIMEDAVARIDWKSQPVEPYLERLTQARTVAKRDEAIRNLGGLISLGNRAAFEALAELLRKQKPPATLEQSSLKRRLLRELSSAREYYRELAMLLVEDLFRTPSNNQTCGWYTDVFRFFERYAHELAEELLTPLLESPQFSYRIKRRIQNILSRE